MAEISKKNKKLYKNLKPISTQVQWIGCTWVLEILDVLLYEKKISYNEWVNFHQSIVNQGGNK